jgi:hypothetical protein
MYDDHRRQYDDWHPPNSDWPRRDRPTPESHYRHVHRLLSSDDSTQAESDNVPPRAQEDA